MGLCYFLHVLNESLGGWSVAYLTVTKFLHDEWKKSQFYILHVQAYLYIIAPRKFRRKWICSWKSCSTSEWIRPNSYNGWIHLGAKSTHILRGRFWEGRIRSLHFQTSVVHLCLGSCLQGHFKLILCYSSWFLMTPKGNSQAHFGVLSLAEKNKDEKTVSLAFVLFLFFVWKSKGVL